MGQTVKRYRLGTHRVRDPDATWSRALEVLPAVGVTRVADLTRLDSVGIPVFQAVRPLSRNLSVSQGKAIDPMGARVSAAMEAIELWHAEDLAHLASARLPLREMEYANPVDSSRFPWRRDTELLDEVPLDWVEARSLAAERAVWLPRAMLEIDYRFSEGIELRMFHVTSNGLASGNCLEEALLHGLCEVIERHALYLAHREPRRRVALELAGEGLGYCAELVERFRAQGMKLAVFDITCELGVAAFQADVAASDLPNVWRGAGCHPDPRVALARALTEAAQGRLTYIAGARDDLTRFDPVVRRSQPFDEFAEPRPERRLAEIADRSTDTVEGDLELVLERLAAGGYEPLWVDLTRPAIGIPVVFVVVPGLREVSYG